MLTNLLTYYPGDGYLDYTQIVDSPDLRIIFSQVSDTPPFSGTRHVAALCHNLNGPLKLNPARNNWCLLPGKVLRLWLTTRFSPQLQFLYHQETHTVRLAGSIRGTSTPSTKKLPGCVRPCERRRLGNGNSSIKSLRTAPRKGARCYV